MQCLGGFSKHRDLIGWGQFFLTDKFVSRFSQHWDKISTNGLWHCVFPEFACLGKLFIFFGNGRSRDRHVTNHVNAKWGLWWFIWPIWVSKWPIQLHDSISGHFRYSPPIDPEFEASEKRFFIPSVLDLNLKMSHFQWWRHHQYSQFSEFDHFEVLWSITWPLRIKFVFQFFIIFFSKSKSNTQSESFWKPLWSGVQWIDHDQIGLSAYGRDYVITEKIG